MERKLSKIYYSSKGFWKGQSAIKKLSEAAKVSEILAKEWLKKQAIWQIYLPAPRKIPNQKFNITKPNEIHQADLLFLPHDRVRKMTFKYAIASRYKAAEALTSKYSKEISNAFRRIHKETPLTYPKFLQVDPGREFMGATKKLLVKNGVSIRLGSLHKPQGLVEWFNKSLGERLFGYQYAQEMKMSATNDDSRSREWVI